MNVSRATQTTEREAIAAPPRLRVAILTMDGVELDEVVRARAALERSGADGVLVSPKLGCIAAYRGLGLAGELNVSIALDASDATQFDGLVVPGGLWQADSLRSLPSAVRFVRSFAEAEKPIAVIGHAASLLIEAGLATGRAISGAPSVRTDLVNADAEFVDRDVVHDGLVLSGRSVPAFYSALEEHLTMHTRHRRRDAGPIAQFWARLRGTSSMSDGAR